MNKTDKKIEEQYKKVEDIKLPHRWKYNSEYMRMENIADVHDENDEFMGTCPIALVPHDIKQFIYDNYTPNTEVQKAVEEGVRGFAESIRFDFSQMGLVVRPKWTDPRAFIQCTCGQILQTVGESRQHWQDGHFDETTSEFADKIINKNIETYLQSLDKGNRE